MSQQFSGINAKTLPWLSYISIVSVIIYTCLFATGPGPIPWFMVTEMFAQGHRSAAVSVSVVINWLCNFAVGLVFPNLQKSFLPFSVMLLLFFIFTYMFVPETKGKTKLGPNGSAAKLGLNGSAAKLGPNGSAAKLGLNGSAAKLGLNGSAAKLGLNGSAAKLGPNGSAAKLGLNGSAAKLGPNGSAAKLGPNGSAAKFFTTQPLCLLKGFQSYNKLRKTKCS
nr:solute carrier family 2; facilitated glucose transporter member 1-like [Biomphalaria glabrata]